MKRASVMALLLGFALLLAAFAADVILAKSGGEPLFHRFFMEDPAGEGAANTSSAFYVIRERPEGCTAAFRLDGKWLSTTLLVAVLGGLSARRTGDARVGCCFAGIVLALLIAFFPRSDKNLLGLAVTDFAFPLHLIYAIGRPLEDK